MLFKFKYYNHLIERKEGTTALPQIDNFLPDNIFIFMLCIDCVIENCGFFSIVCVAYYCY